MVRTKPILIACPQYRRTVRGTYQSGEDGSLLLGGDGEYILDHVRCEQYGGRCMQTLCALHRYNKRGPKSWYPKIILAHPSAKRPPRPRKADPTGESSISVEA